MSITSTVKRRRGRPPGTHPPPVFTADFHFYTTPEQKEWVLDHGGSAYIRLLIERYRSDQHADHEQTARP